MTRREITRNAGILIFVASLVIPITGLLLHKYLLHYELVKDISLLLFLTPLLATAGFITYIFTRYKSIRRYYRFCRLRRTIEKNLISIKAYEEKEGVNYKILPRVKIAEDRIIIDLSNIKIRKAIEQYTETWSSGLWNNFVVEDTEISENAMQFIIKYEDVTMYEKEIYTINEFKERMRVLVKPYEIYFSKKHIVDLNQHPHWLIAGESGAGKSTLIEQILAQSAIKNFETKVADIHGALSFYNEILDYYYNPKEILAMLKDVQNEMRERMNKIMESRERGKTAINLGYKPMLVLIEEFIDLKTMYDKTEVKEFEEIILSLAVGARKAGIFLFISSQSIGTEVIPANARHNFSKILLGNPASNIIKSTFGDGIDVPKVSFKNKGEGFICINNKVSILKCAYIKDLDANIL